MKTIDAVHDLPEDAIPLGYSLSQDYPNPFNPATRITYSVSNDGHISLRVFNVLGQEVAVLFEGFRRTGTYHTTFDGAGQSSGLYLTPLSAANFVETKKMLLLR